MNTIQIRIDEQTKNESKKILETLGIDMSAAIKLFLRQVTIQKGIPFPIITENGFVPEQEQQMIRESNNTLRAYNKGKIKGYTSAKKLMTDILA